MSPARKLYKTAFFAALCTIVIFSVNRIGSAEPTPAGAGNVQVVSGR